MMYIQHDTRVDGMSPRSKLVPKCGARGRPYVPHTAAGCSPWVGFPPANSGIALRERYPNSEMTFSLWKHAKLCLP
jgi:hypothetical protein